VPYSQGAADGGAGQSRARQRGSVTVNDREARQEVTATAGRLNKLWRIELATSRDDSNALILSLDLLPQLRQPIGIAVPLVQYQDLELGPGLVGDNVDNCLIRLPRSLNDILLEAQEHRR